MTRIWLSVNVLLSDFIFHASRPRMWPFFNMRISFFFLSPYYDHHSCSWILPDVVAFYMYVGFAYYSLCFPISNIQLAWCRTALRINMFIFFGMRNRSELWNRVLASITLTTSNGITNLQLFRVCVFDLECLIVELHEHWTRLFSRDGAASGKHHAKLGRSFHRQFRTVKVVL